MPAQLINLTPHEITVLERDRAVVIPPSGSVARCRVTWRKFGYVSLSSGAVPLSRVAYGRIEGLPDPRPRTWYIVSSRVALAARGRTDLLVPHGPIRRGGRVVGCKALAEA